MIKKQAISKPAPEAVLSQGKSVLAKLMAAENITVNHRPVKTASFDLKNRILTCPIWQDMTGVVYDLLMGHEISHALHTPLAGWHDAIVGDKARPNIKRFLNVVEDARIERIIKDKYPGLKKSFVQAYQQLFDRDLFRIKRLNGDYTKLKLIDRVNVHFKLGALAMVQFTASEQKIVDRIAVAATWDEVEQLAREIYDLQKQTAKKEQKQKQDAAKQPQPKKQESKKEKQESEESESSESEDSDGEPEEGDDQQDDEQEGSGESDAGDEEESESGDSTEAEEADESEEDAEGTAGDETEDADDGEEESESSGAGDDESDDEETEESEEDKPTPSQEGGIGESDDLDDIEVPEPTSETDDAFRAAEGSLANEYATSQVFFNIPKANLKSIVHPINKIVDGVEKGLRYHMQKYYGDKMSYDVVVGKMNQVFNARNKAYIDMLVKEFEMKKNANQYSRTLESKSGELNCNKIARYRVTRDLFKKVTTVEKGKNHGMIMFIDFSTSMQGQIRFVVEQALILATFCKRVGIPFDVYSFTDGGYSLGGATKQFDVADDQTFSISGKLILRHHLSSKLNGGAYKRAFNALYIFSEVLNGSGRTPEMGACFPIATYSASGETGIKLAGTPYMEMLVASKTIIEEFKAEHRSDIVNVVHLTDGDGAMTMAFPESFSRTVSGSTYSNAGQWDRYQFGLRDPKTKKMVLTKQAGQVQDYRNNFFQSALTKLVSESTGARHIGYFFGARSEILERVSRTVKLGVQASKDLEQNGFLAAPVLGFDNYFFVDIANVAAPVIDRLYSSARVEELGKQFTDIQLKKAKAKMVARQFAGLVAADI